MSNLRRSMMMAGRGGGVLPSGYTQLEYIVNPSTAYINTGIVMADTDSIRIVLLASNTTFFVTGKNASNGERRMFISQNRCQWQTRPDTHNIYDGSKHTIELSNGKRVLDGVIITFSGGSISDTGSISLFSAWQTGSSINPDSRMMEGRMYEAQILDANGNYRFNGIPAKDTNGIVGLYDVISKTFFTSASDVAFTE